MKIIIFLLGLFAIGCVLYGISAGVQAIQRGLSWITSGSGDHDIRTMPQPHGSASLNVDAPGTKFPNAETSLLQQGIRDLRELLAMHQQGTLTREEFEQLKRHIITAIQSTPDFR